MTWLKLGTQPPLFMVKQVLKELKMEIKVSDLEQLTKKMFEYIKDQEIQSITIEKDFYWNVSYEEKYDSYQEPAELDVGQLTDDWQELLNILNGKSELCNLAFVWLAQILHAIGLHDKLKQV